jgi:hypothetical protein
MKKRSAMKAAAVDYAKPELPPHNKIIIEPSRPHPAIPGIQKIYKNEIELMLDVAKSRPATAGKRNLNYDGKFLKIYSYKFKPDIWEGGAEDPDILIKLGKENKIRLEGDL